MQLFPGRISLFVVLTLAGCGGSSEVLPELTKVSGTVTLDGNPLPKATVIFFPQGAGQVSRGVTNELGIYDLEFQPQVAGAVRGQHRVEIRTGGETMDENGNLISETPEMLPAAYHAKSQLTADVGETDAVIDFDLKSR